MFRLLVTDCWLLDIGRNVCKNYFYKNLQSWGNKKFIC